MKNSSIESAEDQLRLTNDELNRRIGLHEETLVENERTGEALQDSEKRYRRLFESAKDGILILDANTGKVDDVNPYLMQLLGYSHDAIYGKHLWELGAFKDIAASRDAFKTLQEKRYIRYEDLPLQTQDGRSIAVEFVSNVYLVDHRNVIQCNIRDITSRKQAEAERKQLMEAIEQAAETIVMTDAQGIIQFVNPAFERTTGYRRQEAIGQDPSFLKSGKQDDRFYRDLWETIAGGQTWEGRLVNKRKNGTLYTSEMTISPVRDPSGRIVNYVAVTRDISEHLRLLAQFQQSQKMEAIGLLAGGVAHDFNNMLGVILGYTDMALGKLDPAHPAYADLEAILKAANRSTDITRQLLAFARKQTVSPVVLDLNRTVESMLKMLRRLIGENIELVWRPDTNRSSVKVDPTQVDQILANLCINARDAISDIGKITIETGVAVLDAAFCNHHAGAVAGEYVLLAVSDDGCGIKEEFLHNIFDPFFTSKGMGRGTGLGLATVYGIVKQNNGYIDVCSEPDQGTTFRIYLPRHLGPAVDTPRRKTADLPLGHGETVLVVEDEHALLKLSKTMLENLGYRVLAAGSPAEALGLAEAHANEIKLLVTDVIMPEMNGRHLAERLQLLAPGMKGLFMSGFTANMIADRGVLSEEVNFIQKPFTLKELAAKVRETLGEQ